MAKLRLEEKTALITALSEYLDTRDKRFMFLKIEFPDLLPMIMIEGSQLSVAREIYFMFEKQSMLGSLIATMNNVFKLNLTIMMILDHKL